MDTGKQNTRGSLFNQKYFDGYTRRITLRDERLRSQFVYEGTVYTPRAGAPAWRRAKGFCLLLWAALACALGSGAAALAEVRLLAAERYDAAPSEERPSGIDLTADFERGN